MGTNCGKDLCKKCGTTFSIKDVMAKHQNIFLVKAKHCLMNFPNENCFKV